jgi:hypothetical protein
MVGIPASDRGETLKTGGCEMNECSATQKKAEMGQIKIQATLWEVLRCT